MIPIGKKDPAFEAKKRKAAMPPMLMVAKKSAPEIEIEIEPEVEAKPESAAASADANPAAVGYRSDTETCGQCAYHSDGFCQYPAVAMETPDGASCMAFKAGEVEEMAEIEAEEVPE